MRKLTGLQWIIVILTLATALIHIYLGVSAWGDIPALAASWLLDGIGYIFILVLLYFSGRTGRGRSTMRWILIFYTLLTLILYFVVNGSEAFNDTLGLITKGIEALLIILLFVDRSRDRVAVTAQVPVETTVATRAAPQVTAPVASAVDASALAAAADNETVETTPTAATVGISREALNDFFGDIDAMTEDEWRATLMGHLGLIGDTSQFDRPIEYIEGVNDTLGRKWRAINVTKTVDLLVFGATVKGRAALAKRSGFDASQILGWANQVDLYRIRGVGKEYAELLEQSGVDTVVELAQRNPGNLQKQMVKVNEEKKLVIRTPNLAEVENWVEQANTLPRVIQY